MGGGDNSAPSVSSAPKRFDVLSFGRQKCFGFDLDVERLRRLKRGIERPCGSTSKVHGVAALISIPRLSRGPVRFGEFGLAYELCSNPVLLPLSPPHSIERITEHVQYIFIETLSIGVAVEGAIRHGSMHEKAHQRRGHPQSSGAIIRD